MARTFTLEEISTRDCQERGGIWVIIDNYVLDLTSFIGHHPAGAKKIIDRRKNSVDVSSNFLDHFGHTVRSFRDACQRYDRTNQTVVLRFPNVVGEVLIIGKVAQ
eukprot:CAMPEP_0181120874 /NCGR_PEP_ID=MMETSP1071-20121207/24412_1 /TAXON_ID=35127 /ORGANISM="Thalassiosira sp., Strain NH16" /LENGTH=104 /DNA_ID=CAMNT_0023205605 /DNA_START=230 /DNA_END=544 /DNA_ORIENTATION=+